VAQADEQAGRARKDNAPIVMGAIGTGSRGMAILQEAHKKGAKFVAVCDVDGRHREQAVKKLGEWDAEGKVDQFGDFRELLDRKDIDAVTIVVPDHWHTLIAIEAMKRGKDVYCEKPLTLTIAEGQALVKVAAQKNPVFQVGSQQRSDRRFRLACELVRNGRLGPIQTVETRIGDNPEGGPYPTETVPEGLDWNFWLGQTPEVDYVKRRCHYEFRWWYEYSGGKVTDWGAHHNDIAQWGLGMDGSGPVKIESTCDRPKHVEPNCYNCPPNFEITYTYAKDASKYCSETKLVCTSGGENGVKFIGDDGWIFVNRSKIEASDPKLLDEPLKDDALKLYHSDDHMRNFLDCVRSREKTICPPEVGHRSVSVCHLGNISMRLGGRTLQWDPKAEQFFGDPLASQMLSREMRKPWSLNV
jgi:predicted dehydrogenase